MLRLIRLILYELNIKFNNFENGFIFTHGSSTKVNCAFILQENIKEPSELDTFKSTKTDKNPPVHGG